MRKSSFGSLAAILAGTSFFGCGSSSEPVGGGGGANIPAALVGAWTTSCSLVTDPSGTFDPINLVTRERTFTLSLGSDGSYSRSEVLDDKTLANTGGTFELLVPGFIDFTPTGGSTFRWAYATAEFSLSFRYSDLWDFDGNGAFETGDFLLEMNKAGRDPVCSSIPAGLPGSWVAISLTVSDIAQQLELISSGGAFRLDLTAGGTFNYSFTDVGAAVADTAFGLYAVFNNTLFLDDAKGETSDWSFALANSTLRLMFSEGYDFDQNGMDRPANFDISLAKPLPGN